MPPDRDLDRELRDLGPRVEYPPTPDIAGSVRGRLGAEADSPGSPSRSRPQLWWIAAAALVLLVAVPVFSLAMREMGGGAFSAGGGAAGGAAGGGAEVEGRPEQRAAGTSASPSATLEEEDEDLAGSGEEKAADSAIEAVRTPNDKPIPNVVGAPVLEACRELRKRDYAGSVMGEVKNRAVAPGHVIYQEPRAGHKGFQGQPVELIVSEPYPAGKLGRDVNCYDLTEYGPGGKPNVPDTEYGPDGRPRVSNNAPG